MVQLARQVLMVQLARQVLNGAAGPQGAGRSGRARLVLLEPPVRWPAGCHGSGWCC